MITGIRCANESSALRRPPPIADGFTLRCRYPASGPLRHPGIQPRTAAIAHLRVGIVLVIGTIAACHPTAKRQIPLAA